MYVRGNDESQVQKWVDTVHSLRYKDYQLAAPVEAIADPGDGHELKKAGILEEVETVREMGAYMDAMGIQKWWRKSMGFAHG